MEREARNVIKATCQRLVVENKVCVTPGLDPDLIMFFFTLGSYPMKRL